MEDLYIARFSLANSDGNYDGDGTCPTEYRFSASDSLGAFNLAKKRVDVLRRSRRDYALVELTEIVNSRTGVRTPADAFEQQGDSPVMGDGI